MRSLLRMVAVVALFSAIALPSAQAGIDIDFGASVRIDDRTDLYVAMSSRYFGHDRQTVSALGARYRNSDDLAVSLFISKHSGSSPDEIYRLRRGGLSWWDVSIRLGLPVDVWFVEMRRDPGPPYGKAYGYWKKHRHDRKAVVVLGDADVRNLVAVRMIHEYYGVPVDVAMDWRSDGRKLRDVLADEYDRRHGKSAVPAKASKDGPKHAKRHGKGHGKKK